MGLVFVILLGWCLMIGHWMALNAIGVAQRFAPRLARGESWSELWSRGAWKTCSDFQLGGGFVGSFFLLLIGGSLLLMLPVLPIGWANNLTERNFEGLLGFIGFLGMIGALVGLLYLHARLTFFSLGSVSLAECWRATKGNARALMAITALKWTLTCASVLLIGLPLVVVIPYCGLVNDRVREQLMGRLPDTEDKNGSSGVPGPERPITNR
jgi:hypothetical protein